MVNDYMNTLKEKSFEPSNLMTVFKYVISGLNGVTCYCNSSVYKINIVTYR